MPTTETETILAAYMECALWADAPTDEAGDPLQGLRPLAEGTREGAAHTMSLERVTEAARQLDQARAAERSAALDLRAAIRDARKAGHSLAAIAQVLGISRQRVEQLSR